MSLKITRRKWSDLRPHPANPRNGSTEAITDSLRTHGQFKPIVVTKDGTILAGNHTYAAAGELGWDRMDTVVLDIDPDSPSAKGIMLADNRTSDLGEYDDGLLLAMLQDVNESDSLLGTGYDNDDLSDLTALLAYRERESLGTLTDSIGTGAAVKADGSVTEVDMQGRAANYNNLDTRSIILSYPVDGYQNLMDCLAQVRDLAGVDTNADAVRVALDAYLVAHG